MVDDDDHIITNEALEIFKANVDRLERAAEIEPNLLEEEVKCFKTANLFLVVRLGDFDSEINVCFLLSEHGDLYFYCIVIAYVLSSCLLALDT